MSESEGHDLNPGDLVQITADDHAWFPCVLVVGEVKDWGVQAAVLAPTSNAPGSETVQYWIRLRIGTFVRVGRAEVIPG